MFRPRSAAGNVTRHTSSPRRRSISSASSARWTNASAGLRVAARNSVRSRSRSARRRNALPAASPASGYRVLARQRGRQRAQARIAKAAAGHAPVPLAAPRAHGVLVRRERALRVEQRERPALLRRVRRARCIELAIHGIAREPGPSGAAARAVRDDREVRPGREPAQRGLPWLGHPVRDGGSFFAPAAAQQAFDRVSIARRQDAARPAPEACRAQQLEQARELAHVLHAPPQRLVRPFTVTRADARLRILEAAASARHGGDVRLLASACTAASTASRSAGPSTTSALAAVCASSAATRAAVRFLEASANRADAPFRALVEGAQGGARGFGQRGGLLLGRRDRSGGGGLGLQHAGDRRVDRVVGRERLGDGHGRAALPKAMPARGRRQVGRLSRAETTSTRC